ncbi:MAG: MFS transporter [Actinobacteria bacterium]|nr:MFS transporter [Actinomycetota bacterium]
MNTPLASKQDPASGPERTQWIQLAVICTANFVVWSGFGAILPYLPVFLQEQAHASVWLIGVVASAYFVGTFAFSAPLGRLSDSVGRKPMIVAGVSFFAVATVLFVSTTHPAWFILFRLLEGIGAAAVTPAGQALVAELTCEGERSRAYGWLTTSQFGGLVAGPVFAWALYGLGGGHGKWAFYSVFLFGSALSALTAIALMILVREPEHARRRRAVKVKHPPYRTLITRPVLAFLVIAASGNFALGVFEVLWSLWLRHLGASVRFVGLTWIAFSVPMLLAWVGGYLADRYSRWALMFSGYTVAGFAWITYGVTRNLVLFLIVNVIEGLAVAWSYPAKQAFFVQVVPERWLGSVQGLEQTCLQAAALIGTLIAPLLYGVLSGYVISLAGAISLFGLVFAAPTLRAEHKRQRARADEQAAVTVHVSSGR